MGTINVDFKKFYSMANECDQAAVEYKSYIGQMRSLVSSLMAMKEPSLNIAISHINELISDMESSVTDLEGIADRLNRNLSALKKAQDAVTDLANKLSGGN